LDVGADPAPLASEALRGAGARLVDREGRAYMARFHAKAELAPRDIVARANHRQIVEGKGAFLDATQAIGADFPEEFPTIFAAAMAAGVDPRKQPMPIAPAEHYHMGGIATDENGLTSLPGLYAVGECASTGVHGANRLASNSLLEAAVFGARAGRAARDEVDPGTEALPATPPPALPEAAITTLRVAMSRDAGVVRERAGLEHLIGVIDQLEAQYGRALPLVAARLIAQCALTRRESRGGHYRADFPAISAPARRTFVTWKDIEARRAAA
jgi:L-aspartate oxidase